MLWCVYKGISPESVGVKNSLIESIPSFETVGLLTHLGGTLEVDIPVLNWDAYSKVIAITDEMRDRLITVIGADYLEYLRGSQIKLPSHLTSVPQIRLYEPAMQLIVMGAVREAYDRGLHLNDVDYCCPPVVLAYKV